MSIAPIVLAAAGLAAAAPFQETKASLQEAYSTELQAHLGYIACARRAREERYPEMAVLFAALAQSESVHARRFKTVLKALGTPPPEVKRPDRLAQSTRENLRLALEAELQEVDKDYPARLARARPENHPAALLALDNAWRSEKLHRDLLIKGRRYTGMLFSTLARILERLRPRLFICELCGACVLKPPDKACVVCQGPPSAYHEVEPNSFFAGIGAGE